MKLHGREIELPEQVIIGESVKPSPFKAMLTLAALAAVGLLLFRK